MIIGIGKLIIQNVEYVTQHSAKIIAHIIHKIFRYKLSFGKCRNITALAQEVGLCVFLDLTCTSPMPGTS